jgi:hypothetical protein
MAINGKGIQKKLNFRTRIKRLTRRTIYFSKQEYRHDIVIGLYINQPDYIFNALQKIPRNKIGGIFLELSRR